MNIYGSEVYWYKDSVQDNYRVPIKRKEAFLVEISYCFHVLSKYSHFVSFIIYCVGFKDLSGKGKIFVFCPRLVNLLFEEDIVIVTTAVLTHCLTSLNLFHFLSLLFLQRFENGKYNAGRKEEEYKDNR